MDKYLFAGLVDEWKRTRPPSSRMKDLTRVPAYREIVKGGWVAIPFIIEELQREPDHYFQALFEITGADPVKPEHRGKLKLMAEDWIQWWKDQSTSTSTTSIG